MVVCGVGRADLSIDEAISEQDFGVVHLREYAFGGKSTKTELIRYIPGVVKKLSAHPDVSF